MRFLFKSKRNEQKPTDMQVLYDNIRKIRLLSDIILHTEEVLNKRPEFINENEGFFKTNFKRIKNRFTNDFYKKASENLSIKISKFNELSEEKISNTTSIQQLNEMIKEIKTTSLNISINVFKEDQYKLGKIEFVMNVLSDNIVEYANNDEALEIISFALDENDNFVYNVKSDLTEAYQKIGIKKRDITNKLELPILTGVAAIILANPFISAGVIGVSIAEGILSLSNADFSLFDTIKTGAEGIINDLQKEKLLDEFYKLNIDQTAFSLAKSTVLLLEVNKFRKNDPVAQEIYESYVENYIDIKSDIALKMFLSEDIDDNLQKTKIFNNVDIFVANKLKTV